MTANEEYNLKNKTEQNLLVEWVRIGLDGSVNPHEVACGWELPFFPDSPPAGRAGYREIFAVVDMGRLMLPIRMAREVL